MIKSLLVIILLTVSSSILGQQVLKATHKLTDSEQIQLDPTYFTLGTLWDYLGRFTYVDKYSQIDRYYSFEKSLIDYLDSIIQKKLKIVVQIKPDTLPAPSRYETFSTELSPIINSYFNNNYLILDSLKNKPVQNYSYLTGRYYRYGRKVNDSIYLIQLANSANYKVCDSLLRRIGCSKIHFKYLNNVPAQFIYYFIPTAELKKYFDFISAQKKKLDYSYNLAIRTELKLDSNAFIKFNESVTKQNSEIVSLFK